MEVVKQDQFDMDQVLSVLKQGGVIVYPTETVYGLGCDATNEAAVQKVFAVKKRQADKPVLVLMPDLNMVMEYVDWSPKLEELSQKYWPGPLSVVTRVKDQVNLPAGVVGVDRTLAFRVSRHPLAVALCRGLNRPLVSTSANIASMDSPYDIDSVLAMFSASDHRPDLVIDAGVLPDHQPSTIVRLINDHVEVLRQGEIVIEA